MTEYIIPLSLGPNYISLPALPANTNPDVIFGPEVNIWRYNASYEEWESVSNVTCGKGYYAYSPVEKNITITGTDCIVSIDSITHIYDALQLNQYALIGPGATNLNVTETPLAGSVMTYTDNNEFKYTNILEVGKGYWLEKHAPPVPSSTNFYIIMAIMAAAAAFGIIRRFK